jgi:putative membrane protein
MKARLRSFTMNMKRIWLAAFGAAVLVAPSILVGQVDPTANSAPYPQSPQGMNQPAPGQTGSNPATGAQTNQTSSMRDSLGAPGQTGQQMLDKQFVRAAAEGGLADVKLGTLAVEKGGPEVKELAQKMVDDHTAMNKDMAAVADSLGVMLPRKVSKDGQKEYDKLNGLSGKDFDTEYLTYTVNTHREVLHNFYMESSAAADPDLQSVVVKALMTMHQHLGLISKTATAAGITLPPRPPRPAPATASK